MPIILGIFSNMYWNVWISEIFIGYLFFCVVHKHDNFMHMQTDSNFKRSGNHSIFGDFTIICS